MKIAVFSDVHDNLLRWKEAAEIIKAEKIKIGICCGDIGDLNAVEEVAKSFETLYLALGNLDFELKHRIDSGLGPNDEPNKNVTGLFPKNVVFAPDFGEVVLDKRKIAYVHNNRTAKQLAESGRYDIVFYGHTHTPWEEKTGNTLMINPGEVAGQFGRASFAIFNLKTLKAELKVLK